MSKSGQKKYQDHVKASPAKHRWKQWDSLSKKVQSKWSRKAPRGK